MSLTRAKREPWGSGPTISFFTLSGGPARAPARHSFKDRVAAAADAGFAAIGLATEDFRQMIDAGATAAGLRAQLDERDLSVGELEFLPAWADPEQDRANREMEATVWEMSAAFGARQLNVGLLLAPERLPLRETIVERFGELCDRAAANGLVVALEPMAISRLRSPTCAWEIISTAGRPNAGLLIDAFHFFRAGATFDEVRQLPRHAIVSVQLNDAPLTPSSDIREEGVNRRLFPGEGELDLAGLLRAIAETGARPGIAIEVMSATAREWSAAEIARTAANAVRTVCAHAALETPR